nr:hypothetical protein [Tanacetum cinerariifolium]
MERGFLSQKGSGVGRGVKEKQSSMTDKEKSGLNIEVVKEKDGVVPSVLVDAWDVAKEVVSPSVSLMDTSGLRSYLPLPTHGTTTAVNNPGKSSYANITGKPRGEKVNVRTLFTPEGNGIDVVVPVDSIRAKYLGLDVMLENGPWFIRHNSLILKKWHPDENLLKEDVSTVLVGVKLHGVPVTAFSEDGLRAIATKLGTPLMIDSYTSDMCMQSWGRSSYARVMIELRTEVELKDNIIVVMPKITRKGHYTYNVRVEYE